MFGDMHRGDEEIIIFSDIRLTFHKKFYVLPIQFLLGFFMEKTNNLKIG